MGVNRGKSAPCSIHDFQGTILATPNSSGKLAERITQSATVGVTEEFVDYHHRCGILAWR